MHSRDIMTPNDRPDLDILSINTMRTLAIDAIQQAKSGHPGTPMGMSPTVYALWQRVLRFDPQDPIWPNRDRFVLSAGHASMLLYSVLHLTGTRAVDPDYEILGRPSVSLEDIRTFRQRGSRCAGHPEYRWTSGVETTTGPLGQGLATSVGMAIGARWLAARYNRPEFDLFDYDVYSLCGDGCMMEGVSSEAASLAGHLRLSTTSSRSSAVSMCSDPRPTVLRCSSSTATSGTGRRTARARVRRTVSRSATKRCV
jgi:transketolase